MSRPFTEVILIDNVRVQPGDRIGLLSDSDYAGSIKLNQDTIHKIWGGSKADFIKLFDLPSDVPLESQNVGQIAYNRNATINFKINYQIWYSTPSGYVPGSNNTTNITIPSFLIFKDNGNSVPVGSSTLVYNPNLFPLTQQINDFIKSNKNPVGFNASTFGNFGTWTPFLLIRYGQDGQDIQICILTRANGQIVLNSSSFLIPYFSMTFTGFNKIKRLS